MTKPMLPRTAAALLVFAFASCNTYEFAKARKPNGEYDIAKLAADLKASGTPQLSEGIWIPLIYLRLTTFKASDPKYPAGYTLSDYTAVGPIFCGGSAVETVVDDKGAPIERDGKSWVAWGVLYHDIDERVETTSGQRRWQRRRYALLFGNDDTIYARQQP